jgi:hypothetical protein
MAIRPLRDMLVAMTDTDIQSKLGEYENMVRLLTAKLEELAAENARLRSSENTAHSVLREVYNDPTASPAVRVKAAGLALPHETPRLTPIAPAIDATCEEIKPLHQVVEEQRARAARMLLEDPKYRDLPKEVFSSRGDKVFVYSAGGGGYSSDDNSSGGDDDTAG